MSRLSRPRSAAACLLVGALTLGLAACGGDDDQAGSAAGAATTAAVSAATTVATPEPTRPPSDLTADEVCALVDERTLAGLLGTEVTGMRPGGGRADCVWFYKLPDGLTTNLQVQVMTMEQTDQRVGTEALEWGLSRAPEGSEISEVAALGVPNGSYVFGVSTVVLAVDAAGRLITVMAHTESPEEGRHGVVRAALDALAATHPR